MKVIVAHEGKQHVNQLLIGIDRQGWLQKFYVGFASNRLPTILHRVTYLAHWLRKKQFVNFDTTRIRSLYISTLLARLTANHYLQVFVAFQLFDRWVSMKLQSETDFDIFVGYENCNLLSFQTTKRLGKLTILDLAHIHQEQSLAIRQRYIPESINVQEILKINARKEAALLQSDYIFTLSSFATTSLCERGINRLKVYELNLGVDIKLFHPATRQHKSFVVLYTGTLHWMKGIEQLLSAFRSLNIPNAQLFLIGPVGDADILLTQCTGAIRHIPFLHHNELVAYYQQADVFVFPSYLDSWGQVVLEAMACGTPVIVSENTGAKDAVAKGGGFIIPTGDEMALREKIRYVYDHPEERELLGREARRVAEQYTWENYYEQVRNALTDIAQREGIPV